MTEVLPPTIAQRSVGLFNNSKHWQERAEEARAHAEQLTDPELEQMMLETKAIRGSPRGRKSDNERRTRRSLNGL
jgi:hypothetical protein